MKFSTLTHPTAFNYLFAFSATLIALVSCNQENSSPQSSFGSHLSNQPFSSGIAVDSSYTGQIVIDTVDEMGFVIIVQNPSDTVHVGFHYQTEFSYLTSKSITNGRVSIYTNDDILIEDLSGASLPDLITFNASPSNPSAYGEIVTSFGIGQWDAPTPNPGGSPVVPWGASCKCVKKSNFPGAVCKSGGEGASSCSHSYTTISGGTESCKVSCTGDYYACCNERK